MRNEWAFSPHTGHSMTRRGTSIPRGGHCFRLLLVARKFCAVSRRASDRYFTVVVISADRSLFDNKCTEPYGDLPPLCGSLPYLKLAQALFARLVGVSFFDKRTV